MEISRPGRVDRGVKHVWTRRYDLRKARRGPKNVAEQFEQASVRAQDRHKLDRGAHPAERLVESSKRRIGVARFRKGSKKRGREFRQDLPRARAANSGPPSEMPPANGLGGALGVLEAEPAQGRERLGIVVV